MNGNRLLATLTMVLTLAMSPGCGRSDPAGKKAKLDVAARSEVKEKVDDQQVAEALAAFGKAGRSDVRLGEFGPEIRAGRHPEIVPALLQSIKSQELHQSMAAFSALGRLRVEARTVVAALVEELKGVNGMYAAQAIGEFGDEAASAVPALVAAADGADLGVRIAALSALGRIPAGAESAVPVLVKATKDTRRGVRTAACEAIGNLGPAARSAAGALKPLLEAGPTVSDDIVVAAAAALCRIGEPEAGLPVLMAQVRSGDPIKSLEPCRVLCDLKCPRTSLLPELMEMLKTDQRFRAAAILGSMGAEAKDAVPLLTAQLKTRDVDSQCSAASALFRISGSDAGLPALRERLKSPKTFSYAASSLTVFGPAGRAALPELAAGLDDPELCFDAADCIAAVAGPEDVPLLIRAVERSISAARALGKLGPAAKEAVPALTKQLTSRSVGIRRAAADALALINR